MPRGAAAGGGIAGVAPEVGKRARRRPGRAGRARGPGAGAGLRCAGAPGPCGEPAPAAAAPREAGRSRRGAEAGDPGGNAGRR